MYLNFSGKTTPFLEYMDDKRDVAMVTIEVKFSTVETVVSSKRTSLAEIVGGIGTKRCSARGRILDLFACLFSLFLSEFKSKAKEVEIAANFQDHNIHKLHKIYGCGHWDVVSIKGSKGPIPRSYQYYSCIWYSYK